MHITHRISRRYALALLGVVKKIDLVRHGAMVLHRCTFETPLEDMMRKEYSFKLRYY